MGTGVTGTSQLSNSIVASHLQTAYMVAAEAEAIWDGFPWVPEDGVIDPGTVGAASAIVVAFYPPMSISLTAASETTDINPQQLGDSTLSISVAEYLDAVQITEKLTALGRTDIPEAVQRVVGAAAGRFQEILARNVFVGGPVFQRPTSGSTRVLLTIAADALTVTNMGWSFLNALKAQLRTNYCPPIGGSREYATVVHSLVTGDIIQANGWLPRVQNNPEPHLLTSQIGEIAGLQVHESECGKVYQSAGVPTQGATTSTAAVIAGATTIALTETTGLTAGDYMTVGAIETATTETADLETVKIISITTGSGAGTATILGKGTGGTNTGFKFPHASGIAVTEAPFVGAIPVFGAQSVAKAYSSMYGPKPKLFTSGPFDVGARFPNYGYKWLGGYARTLPTWLIRGEVALLGKSIMDNGY